MACANCDKAAEAGEVYWYRWGAANIGIIGCRKDVREVMDALRKAQEARG